MKLKLNSINEEMEDNEVIKFINKQKSMENCGTPFIFSLKNRIGGLAKALKVFQVRKFI